MVNRRHRGLVDSFIERVQHYRGNFYLAGISFRLLDTLDSANATNKSPARHVKYADEVKCSGYLIPSTTFCVLFRFDYGGRSAPR